MPALYLENVPEDVYEALGARTQGNGKSISAEVLALLAESVPTPKELARRREIVNRMRKLRSRRSARDGSFASAEQMQRAGTAPGDLMCGRRRCSGQMMFTPRDETLVEEALFRA